jgi:hypothetical protein
MSPDNSEKRGIRYSDSSQFLLEFDSSHSEFQRGFECGQIWACLTDEVAEITALITADNAEMVMRMAEAAQYSFEGRYLKEDEIENLQLSNDEWLVVVMRFNHATERQ